MRDQLVPESETVARPHQRWSLAAEIIRAYPRSMNRRAVILALLSAALFGISTPAAKALLGSISPAVLAGLLYCGAGNGVAI